MRTSSLTSPTSDPEPEELDTLRTIAEDLGLTLAQMNRWAEPSRDIGFPEPAEVLGRYKLYNRAQVTRWVELWRRIQKNYKNNNFAKTEESDD